MKHAAYRNPLNDIGLAELGRATLNWGFADMLAGMLLDLILGMRDADAKRHLLSPLMIGKKIEILRKANDRVERDDARDLIRKFCDEITALNAGRNHAIHGFWGWQTSKEGNEPRAAAHSFKSKSPFYAEEISGVADRIADATIIAHQAVMLLTGKNAAGMTYPATFWFGAVPPHNETGEQWKQIGTGEANVRVSPSDDHGH